MRKNLFALLGILLALSGFGAAVFDVTAFGANGGDALDDTKAIQAALDQAKTAAGEIEVRVPAGTYRLASTLCIFSNTRLVLEPDATMLRQGPEAKLLLVGAHLKADGSVCPGNATCTHGGYTQLTNVTITGGTWDAGGSTTDVTGAIQLRHGENIVLRATRLTGCTEHVLNLSATRHVRVENVTFGAGVVYTGTGSDFWSGFTAGDPDRFISIEALHLDAALSAGESSIYPRDGTGCQDITVTGCSFEETFAGVGNHHVYEGVRGAGLTVTNCCFTGLRSHAVHAHGFTDCSIVDNDVSGCAGLVFGRTCGVRASGNAVKVTTGHGVSLSGGSTCTLRDNSFAEVGGHGVYIEGGSLAMKNNTLNACGLIGVRAKGIAMNSAIVANEMNGVQGVGIQLTGSKWVSVSGNEIYGSGGQSILLSATTNCTVSGNVITDPQAEGISFRASIGGRINRNVVTGARGVALRVGGSDTTVTTATITDNDLESVAQDGWDLFAYIMSGGTVTDNVCRGRGPYLRDPTLSKITYRPANATDVEFDPMGVSDVAVVWERVPYAKGYVVEYATKKDFSDAQRVEITDVEQTWCELTGLSAASRWYFRVCTVQVIAGARYVSAGTTPAMFEKAPTYRIRFNRNDGSGQTADVDFIYGEKTPLPYLRSELGWARDGYVFKGWATSAAATKLWKVDHAVVASPVAAGKTLNVYAQWAVDTTCYTVRFDPNGGTGEGTDQLGFKLGTGRALATNVFVRTGYIFMGWARTATATKAAYADGAKVYTPSGVTAGSTLTLYAVWANDPACTRISFNANGGTGKMASVTGYSAAAQKTLPANAFARGWYRFAGWSRSATAGQAEYADKAEFVVASTVPGETEITLYAIWEKDPWAYAMAFVANGGTGTMARQAGYSYGQPKKINLCRFTRPGYRFLGWGTYPTATTAAYADGAIISRPAKYAGYGSCCTITLYAVWEPESTAAVSTAACRVAPPSSEVLCGLLADGSGTYLLKLTPGTDPTGELAIFTADTTHLLTVTVESLDDHLLLSDTAGEPLALIDLATDHMVLQN